MTNLKLDFYQIFGVICPGIIIILGISLIYPEVADFWVMNLTLPGISLFLLIAYISGNLIQAFGNWLESAWWKLFGGMPTDWVIKESETLIPESQKEKLLSHIKDKLDISHPSSLNELSIHEWRNISRLMTTAVKNGKRDERLFIFNSMYGLNRGLAASLVFTTILLIFNRIKTIDPTVLIAIATVMALYRMHRFSMNYARELISQFIGLPRDEK